jgi:GT2 family glycosyltransferase
MINNISCSIVLYENDVEQLTNAIVSSLNTNLLSVLYLIDNSPNDSLRNIYNHEKVIYIHNPSNPGFGTAHNIAIEKCLRSSQFHLILNPDIYFDSNVLPEMVNYMASHTNIGVMMPKVLYPDGSIQYLAKLLPTLADFIFRRLIPIRALKNHINDRFELKKSNYDQILDVPFLSGCFLLFRTNVLEEIKGFDEKIFMYTEDIDICRRVIDAAYRCVFFPKVHAYHDHEKKSFKDLKNLKVYLKSAIYYFNKWGWFFDSRRVKINKATLKQIK